jgi:phosphoribosyl-AMP cyclohydrolase
MWTPASISSACPMDWTAKGGDAVAIFPPPGDKQALERGGVLTPRFGPDGLIAAIATDADTGEAHYWSRSRNELWHKGATSGQIQTVAEIRIDCDQDAVWLKVRPQGDGGACHTGARSCFYRVIEGGALRRIE